MLETVKNSIDIIAAVNAQSAQNDTVSQNSEKLNKNHLRGIMLLRCFYVYTVKFKNSGRNLKILFSVVCVSIIAVGVIVYFSTSGADDVNEPTTIADTTEVQRAVTVEDTTAQSTTAQSTTAATTQKEEETSMAQSDKNTPYKSYYEYPISETAVQGYSEELVKNETMGDYRSHTAVDFAGAAGDEVIAINDGIVLDVYNDALLGMTVEIDHGGKLVAKYCGLDSVSVKKAARWIRARV